MRAVIVGVDGAAVEAVRRALRYAPTLQVLGWMDARRPYGSIDGVPAPDVVVLDDGGGLATVLDRARDVASVHPEAKVVLLTRAVDPPLLAEAANARVDAVVSKSVSPAAVGMLVREIAAGNIFHFPAARASAPSTGAVDHPLTTRELQILRLVAGGLSNSRIAAELWVTEQTVKFHLSNVYRKLGLANRTQAAHYAHLHNLVGATSPEATSISVAA